MRWSFVFVWLRRMLSIAGLALPVLAGPVHAQTTTGNVRGYVTGANGAPVGDVTVAARNVDMNTTRPTLTGENGFYYLGGLRPGRYELTARRVGFAPQTRSVQVLIGETIDINFQVTETAQQLEAVQVVVAPAAEERRTSEVATNVTRQQIQDLPTVDRNVLDLARLAPGVLPQQPGNTDKFVVAGAQPAEQTNVFVDGASMKNDVLNGGVAGQNSSPGNPFPQDAIQEFRVITQNYKAEYQKASSAIITATTRSGTNSWDGSVFGYGVGRGWEARNAFQVRQNLAPSDFQRLQTGANLGGPLVRDKLFFFGTYEGNFEDSPSDILLGGSANDPKVPASLKQQLLSQTGRFQTQFREHLGFGKLSYVPTERQTLDVSANLRHETDVHGFGGQTSQQAAENLKQDLYTVVGNYKYSGDRWLNEAQVNIQHFTWNPTPLNPNLVGQNYFGLLRIGGKDTEQNFTQGRVGLRDDITRSGVQLGGDHVFKGGVFADFLSYKATKYFYSDPVFDYRSDENFAFPFEAFFGYGNPTISANNTQFGAFLQDDWSVGRQLVLNLGVRWDAETNMADNDYVTPQALRDSLMGPLSNKFFNVNTITGDTVRLLDQLGGFSRYISNGKSSRPTYLGAFQPRLGFSYDVFGNQRTVLFGGFGIYYDRDEWNYMLDERFRRQFQQLRIQFDTIGPRKSCPVCVKWDPRYLDPAQLRQLAASGQAGAPEVFLLKNDLKPPKSNQFSAGVRQAVGPALLTGSYNGIRGYNGFAFVRVTPWGGLLPTYAQAFAATDEIRTWYDAATLKIEKPTLATSRWGGSIAYTYAFHADQQGEYFFSLDDRYLRPSDYPRRVAPLNQKHTVIANGIVNLPYDILFSTLITLGSGYTALGTDASLGWGPGQQRQFTFQPPLTSFLGIGRVFNTKQMDVRLQKELALPGDQRIGILADVFNVFNSPLWGCYDPTIFPANGSPNANYGLPQCAAPGRRVQVGLRYNFAPSVLGRGGR